MCPEVESHGSSWPVQLHGLRAALAHELCHLLFDRKKMRDIQLFCELERADRSAWRGDDYPIERRARAFQAEFLAPKALLVQRWASPAAPGLEGLVQAFGLGPQAVAWQLKNAETPIEVEPTMVVDSRRQWPEWKQLRVRAEPGVPPMRSGRLLELVGRAVRSNVLSSSWGRSLLRTDVDTWDRLYNKWMSSLVGSAA